MSIPVADAEPPVTDQARAERVRATLGVGAPRRRRLVAWIAGAVVVIILGRAWLLRAERQETGPRYQTTAVTRGALTVTVTATGTVESLTQVTVGTEISGVVDKVLVNFNTPVSVGQLLATINTDKLNAQAQQGRASLAANRAKQQQVDATVREAKAQLQRLQEVRTLSNGRVPSQQELDTQQATVARAEADLASAAAQVTQSEASLAAIDSDIRKAQIRSPINGIVLDRQVEPGQTVAASFQTPTLFTLAEDLTRMKLIVDVDEADIGTLKIGQRATFQVDAYPNRHFASRVTEVRSAPKTANSVVTYQVVLTVDNGERLLKPGMTATADIVTTEVTDARLVPNAALRFTPPQNTQARRGVSLLPRPPDARSTIPATNGSRVWVLKQGQPVAVDIVSGRSDGRSTEVTGGTLSPGDQVIVDVQEIK
jgi:HlyD family secretion protein